MELRFQREKEQCEASKGRESRKAAVSPEFPTAQLLVSEVKGPRGVGALNNFVLRSQFRTETSTRPRFAKFIVIASARSRGDRDLVLLSFVQTTLSHEAAGVCCGFTVGRSGSGQWSYNQSVQGQPEGTFLLYKDKKCHNVPRNRPNNMTVCEKVVNTLKDEVYLFKDVLYQVRQEYSTIIEPLTLQAKICCWNEGDGGFSRSWDLSLNGPKTFHIDSNTKKGPEMDSGSTWTKEMAEKIEKVIDLLNRISQGECRSWVRETTLYCEENLEPTASPPTTPSVDQHSSMATKPHFSVLLILLPSIFMCLLRILDKDSYGGRCWKWGWRCSREHDENSSGSAIFPQPFSPFSSASTRGIVMLLA
ncbi:UL16-binding protein 6-like [Psammomys obesus]|uniref:UL16-binding protein 6-like n=1 Tax=Psammomys obesus TaxID=48139 RepID=UPI0024529C6E|nr:UL16-binding protein 6-like [Psammomys obesus]XP_055457482.1 UL16-binding protein 6-like [Psammomys obesus]